MTEEEMMYFLEQLDANEQINECLVVFNCAPPKSRQTTASFKGQPRDIMQHLFAAGMANPHIGMILRGAVAMMDIRQKADN